MTGTPGLQAPGRSAFDWLVGGSLGILAGLLLQLLGVWGIVGKHQLPAILVACWLAGASLTILRANRWLAAADGVFAALVGIVAFVPWVGGLATHWVRADSISAGRLDAIVVLSSGLQSDTALDTAGLDRLLAGAELDRIHGPTRLLTTTAFVSYAGRKMSTQSDQARLVHLTGLDSLWTQLDSVGSTHDEALRAAAALRGPLNRSPAVAVVTSPLHTRRACRTFEQVGFRVTCVAALEHEHNTWHPVTAEDRLAAWRAYLYERLGWLEYRHRGWV